METGSNMSGLKRVVKEGEKLHSKLQKCPVQLAMMVRHRGRKKISNQF